MKAGMDWNTNLTRPYSLTRRNVVFRGEGTGRRKLLIPQLDMVLATNSGHQGEDGWKHGLLVLT
jgi:hypothetical protein